ncbi:MAG: NAD(P)H-dependent flavin oxidoreductase [Canibacter sp.]
MIHPLDIDLRLPVVAAPMFIVSTPELVAEQCQAGIIGSFPALNARTTPQLGEWIDRVRELAGDDAIFAVNQIVHRSNTRLLEDMKLIVDRQVPIVITSLGARPEINEAVHSYGGIVLHDVINDRFARKAIEKGADGLIAVAAGAGGHAGVQSPFALVREIRAWFDGPLLLSGAIAHGASVLAAVAAGADFAYVGSAFLAAEETNASDEYKQLIVDSSAADIVYSNLFTGVHGNYLRGSIEAAGLDPDNLPESDPSKMDFGSGGTTAAKAWKDIWGSGQGIAAVDGVKPAREIIARLEQEFTEAKQRLRSSIAQ